MTRTALAAHAQRAAGWSIAALGLAIPISTAADGILQGIILLAAIAGLASSWPAMRDAVLRTPPVTAAALLFVLLTVGCLYGVASRNDAVSGLGKYLDLALIPMFVWAAANPAIRRSALVCFAVAVALNLYVSYSAAAGWPGLRNPAYPIGFKASVTHSLIIALGSFLFMLAARETQKRGRRGAYIVLAALCAHNVLFIVIGRTGYVVLGLLLAYYICTLFRGWRGPAVATLVVIIAAAAAYGSSESLQKRVNEIGSDLAQWRPGANDTTSVGQRLEYYRTTLAIVADHPVLGVGTGGFAQAYADKIQGTDGRATVNPHNDYLLIAAQVGLGGLVLLLAVYALIWRHAASLATRLECDLARGVVIAMFAGGLFNSLLLDHTEGLLFAWLTAVLFAGFGRARRPGEAPA